MSWFDNLFQGSSTHLADRTSRRSFLSRVGMLAVGGIAIPLLPVSRIGEAHAQRIAPSGGDGEKPGWDDDKNCDYWAHCSVDGSLCSCCGGTANTCPPGSQPSPIAWVGTCRNPTDGKSYVVSYNDCCGLQGCNRCFCNRNEGDTPRYRPQKANSVTWCYGGVSPTYHCTVSRVIALAE